MLGIIETLVGSDLISTRVFQCLLALTVLIGNKPLVTELKKFDVALAGIQTKWFGQDVWNVDVYTLLHSGHTMKICPLQIESESSFD